MKFRKKPVIIEAVQWTGNNDIEILLFMDNPFIIDPKNCYMLQIPILEGIMTASVGDWIIKGVNGEFYPCKPDIFEKTYELVIDNTIKVIDCNKCQFQGKPGCLGAYRCSQAINEGLL